MTDQRPIGYWLKLVDNLIERKFAETLDEHGVTRRQWQLLSVLARGTATVEQLDEAVRPFFSDNESSAEHLSELIDSAWVDATADGYEMTERGFTAFGTLSEVVAQQRTIIGQGISDAEHAQTVAVLEKMARNLGFTG